MKKLSSRSLFFVTLVIVSLLTGCFGGGSSTGKTFKLAVTVLSDDTGIPLEGVLVEVTGKRLDAQKTNANGQVSFSGLSDTVEVEVRSVGFMTQGQSVLMNKDQIITVRLWAAEGTVMVEDQEAFEEALDDPDLRNMILAKDIVFSTPLTINRPVNLNLNGHDLTGDVQYQFEDEQSLTLTGAGQITGNLSITAPNAAVTNHIYVSETIYIVDVASETWSEYAQNNHLVVSGSNILLHIYNDARTIEIAEDTWGSRVNVHQGPVSAFLANSSVQVVGGDKIVHANVNAPGVVFDLSPQEIAGDYKPTIIQSFVPGSGGTIPAFSPSIAPPNTFGGLHVQRNHRWPSYNSTTGHPEVDLYFPTPESLGGNGYVLQYFDRRESTWKTYEDVQTSTETSNNFSIAFWETTPFRLLMIGGPLDGYTSNEIEVTTSSVNTYFSEWGMSAVSSYVGETFVGNATAKRITDGGIVDARHLTYQWYRVDPVSFEMEEIPGANTTQYTTQDEDMGSAILFRATGDRENIGGFVQVWAPNFWGEVVKPILVPNKAFISEVTSSGFTLNLHKNVPSLATDQLELWAYGASAPNEPLEVQSVDFVPGSQAKFAVQVEIPTDLDSLWLTAHTDHWGIVSNYRDEGAPYIREEVKYQF